MESNDVSADGTSSGEEDVLFRIPANQLVAESRVKPTSDGLFNKPVVRRRTLPIENFADIIRCPVCKNGKISNDFTRWGIFLAIIFFPLGILFCILLTEKRCHKCGYKS